MGNPETDWGFSTVPQPGANDRSITLPRGKLLGGSSAVSCFGSQQCSGHASEYDAIEELGTSGWNWKELLPYFKKSETFTVKEKNVSDFSAKFDGRFHGSSGPIHRTLPQWFSNVHHPCLAALDSLGVKYNADGNDGDNIGVHASNVSIDPTKAFRSSSESAYYRPNSAKPNLKVLTGSHATRVITTKSTLTGKLVAGGVELIKDGQPYTISATKEVLLCAGTFQTPQLLELSGIGDKRILQSQGITTLFDLPGDHFWTAFIAKMDPKYESFDQLADELRAAEQFKLFNDSASGMLATGGTSAFAFIPPRDLMGPDKTQEIAKNFNVSDLNEKSPSSRLQSNWFVNNTVPFFEFAPFPGFIPGTGKVAEPGQSHLSFMLGLVHPFSRGTVHINSPDPSRPPSIDPRVLDNDVDINILVETIKFSRKLIMTDALRGIAGPEVAPGPEVQSDGELKEYIRNAVQTVFHPVGTAPLLPQEDGGVVDANLIVYGTDNIRVIDASIIPIQISAHTQATVYAIAEKAADIIRGRTSG
ncbi:alcohol oxidase [Lyophyllum atratum]|nr:alcohol oxidase [Lyophyllum atratum]